HVEQDLAQLALVLGSRREDQLDRELVLRSVLDRPPVEVPSGGRIRVDRDVAVAPLLSGHGRFHRGRDDVVGRGGLVTLARIIDEDVEGRVDRWAVRGGELWLGGQSGGGEG